jgi:hypothetical protein
MIDSPENLAKSSAKKSVPPSSQFDHRPLMPQLCAPRIKHQPDLGGIPPGKTASFQAGI